MRFFSRSLLAALAVSAALATMQAPAARAYGGDAGYDQFAGQKPLVIIRFNQRNVMYERPLYIAVAQALQTKPSAVFDVVSMAPQGDDGTSERSLGRVVGTLTEMGVPRSRLNIVRQANAPVDTSEVHIFVR